MKIVLKNIWRVFSSKLFMFTAPFYYLIINKYLLFNCIRQKQHWKNDNFIKNEVCLKLVTTITTCSYLITFQPYSPCIFRLFIPIDYVHK